jgi:hypothetical protein
MMNMNKTTNKKRWKNTRMYQAMGAASQAVNFLPRGPHLN